MAQALGHVAPSTAPLADSEDKFYKHYTDDGSALSFASLEEIKAVVHSSFTRRLLDDFAEKFSFPLRVALNCPWSIQTPTDEHLAAFDLGLLFQISGAWMGLSHCTNNPAGWNPTAIEATDTCLFSRMFTSLTFTAAAASGAGGPVRQRLQADDLDTLALFPAPYIVTIPGREQRGGQTRNFVTQGCTNCLAAGHWQLCTHWLTAKMMRDAGVNVDTAQLGWGDGVEAAWGAECLRFITDKCSLVNMAE